MMRYTRTQHRPASRQVNDHGRVSGTHRLATQIAHLRTGLEALADRVRNQEERLRHLEHRQPRHKAN